MAAAYRIDDGAGTAGRVELSARIAQLKRDQALLSIAELCRRADTLRGHAHIGGFVALARLAGGLGDALAMHGRAATTRAYLDLMGDALDCPRFDAAAGDAFLAAVSVRLA